MANCKGCGAEIRWSKTKAQKAVPLNVPSEKRFITFIKDDGEEHVELLHTWTSHFSTCPKATEFRKKSQMLSLEEK